jgi:hypothetical protein
MEQSVNLMKTRGASIASSVFVVIVAVFLAGCAGIAEGVTKAVLDKGEEEDTRACHIEGPSAGGLKSMLRAQARGRKAGANNRVMKVLMVHGIGRHIPGYSGRLTEHLMRALSLNIRDEDFKEIVLRDPAISDSMIGTLRISRYMNSDQTQQVLFYELTWSDVIADEKRIIEFDDSTEYAFRRTAVNSYIKRFFNSHVPDSLIFLGEPKLKILSSVRQSLCWMTQGDWEDYPEIADRTCALGKAARLKQMKEDDYIFVTHSLGSRITVDTLQYYGEFLSRGQTKMSRNAAKVLQSKHIKLYMLANQLPLLEMGQKRAKVRNQERAYCRLGGTRRAQRILAQLQIVAFSDPNDILSYPIPPKFADRYMDSRLCPAITNVTLNVAKPTSLFGIADFAHPGEAHGGYDKDERVIQLMANGIGTADTAEVVKTRCTWLNTVKK